MYARRPFAVHGAFARGEALAKPGVEQHELATRFQEQAVARQADAVVHVRGALALPQGLGHHAEHGPPVESKVAAGQVYGLCVA